MGGPGALKKKATKGAGAEPAPAQATASDANTVEAHLDTARAALDAALKAHDAMRWVPTRGGEGRGGTEGDGDAGGMGRAGGDGVGRAVEAPHPGQCCLPPPPPLSLPLSRPHCRAPGPPTWTVPC